MAAPMNTMWSRSLRRLLGRFALQKQVIGQQNWRSLCTGPVLYQKNKDGEVQKSRNPEPVFLDERVQNLLYKVTHINMDSIFRRRPTSDIEPPQYRLLTDKQLEEEQKLAIERARRRIKMPPVMQARSDDYDIISEDPDIAGHDTVKYVFTDITYGIKDRERTMVVREVDGVLRTATAEERDRLQLVYLPPEGRMPRQPEMFHPDQLENILQEGRYEYILERACVQFEPNDPEYIRVTQRTYEHIDAVRAYDAVDSTRHHGVMIFYLAFHHKLDNILIHKIKQEEITAATDLVRLHHIMHPNSASQAASTENDSNLTLIQNFITHDARKTGELELALQSYRDSRLKSARA